MADDEAGRSGQPVPAGELVETLWERMVAIQPSTSSEAKFLRSETAGKGSCSTTELQKPKDQDRSR